MTKVKEGLLAFGGPPSYKAFLDVLHRYKTERLSIATVTAQVDAIFSGHPDREALMRGFRAFLPAGARELGSAGKTSSADEAASTASAVSDAAKQQSQSLEILASHASDAAAAGAAAAAAKGAEGGGAAADEAATPTLAPADALIGRHSLPDFVLKPVLLYRSTSTKASAATATAATAATAAAAAAAAAPPLTPAAAFAAAVAHDDDAAAMRAEAVSVVRLLLEGDDATAVLTGALEAATVRTPPPSTVALALGVLHVLGAEGDTARRGAMGSHRGHRVQLLGAPSVAAGGGGWAKGAANGGGAGDASGASAAASSSKMDGGGGGGADGKVVVAQYAHALRGDDEQHVSIEAAALSELTLSLPPLGASEAAVATLARSVGLLLHAHLPYCGAVEEAATSQAHWSHLCSSRVICRLRCPRRMAGGRIPGQANPRGWWPHPRPGQTHISHGHTHTLTHTLTTHSRHLHRLQVLCAGRRRGRRRFARIAYPRGGGDGCPQDAPRPLSGGCASLPLRLQG